MDTRQEFWNIKEDLESYKMLKKILNKIESNIQFE